MPNNVIRIRNTSLYGSKPSFGAFACKTATLGPKLQVSIGRRPHLWLFCIQNREFSLSDLTCRFVHAKKNVISIRNTSLYVFLTSSAIFACQTATLGPELQVSMGPSRPLGFYMQNKTFGSELQISTGPRPHLWFCACKTA